MRAETVVIVYDSQTGNTEKIARAVAQGLDCNCYRVDSLPNPINYYDLVVFGTPNIRATPLPSILELFKKGVFPRSYAIFVTFGLPFWGQFSSRLLVKKLRNLWEGKNLRYLGSFYCPGYHMKYRTYEERPSEKDMLAAFEFGKKLRVRYYKLNSAEKLQNCIMSLAIKTIGRMSKGIQMSFKYGFTSGLMLDYIYRNEPTGGFIIGKWIDKLYLENPGWQAVRMRKENLKMHLKQAVQENKKKGIKTYILDIASGPARYLVEVLKEIGEEDVFALCQDIDVRWVEEGQKLAAEEEVKNIRYQKGDAFDLKGVSFSPNVIISSGFYDWITDDELVKKSFSIIHAILPQHGKIIFTNQAGHLSMDLVQRTFLDFSGRPLIMKTRPIMLVNSWAKEAGFVNLTTTTDPWGLYSVTTGEKI
jgi:hypothetical protein